MGVEEDHIIECKNCGIEIKKTTPVWSENLQAIVCVYCDEKLKAEDR